MIVRMRLLLTLLMLAMVGGSTLLAETQLGSADAAQLEAALAAMPVHHYQPQRVVYQVTEGGGWLRHGYRGVLKSLRNHVDAVGASNIQVRVVLQGQGLGLLLTSDEAERAAIDMLRQRGVRFLVCRNSLLEAGRNLQSYAGLTVADVVPAGVAAVTELEMQGFVYMHL